MIKVIASDLDETLLNENHKLAQKTYETIKKVQKNGVRFIVVTGRDFEGVMEAFDKKEVTCDYILGNGSEVRDINQEVIQSYALDYEVCKSIEKIANKYDTSLVCHTGGLDYRLGTEEELRKSIIDQMESFGVEGTREEIAQTSLFHRILSRTKSVLNINGLEDEKLQVYKLTAFSSDTKILDAMKVELEAIDTIAVASSFSTNIEITAKAAQKGPILKSYIEALGYTMDEVLAIGDSPNDFSMLSMDFGATVAMENAYDELKRVAKYITKSNVEYGAAYAMELAMENQLDKIINDRY